MGEALLVGVGFVLGLGTEYFRHRLVSEREETSREANRADRRSELQRESVLEFQNSFMRYLNIVNAVHARRKKVLLETGEWRRERTPDEEKQGSEALVDAYKFANRIADPKLASACLDLMLVTDHMSRGDTKESAEEASLDLSEMLPSVNESILEYLQEL